MATYEEAQRIAQAIHALRPEWNARSILTGITNHHANTAMTDLAVMLTIAACNPENQTPAVIDKPGPWRDAVKRTHEADTYVPQGRECRHHPEERADRCTKCDAHARATTDAHAGADLVRQALKEARSNNR